MDLHARVRKMIAGSILMSDQHRDVLSQIEPHLEDEQCQALITILEGETQDLSQVLANYDQAHPEENIMGSLKDLLTQDRKVLRRGLEAKSDSRDEVELKDLGRQLMKI